MRKIIIIVLLASMLVKCTNYPPTPIVVKDYVVIGSVLDESYFQTVFNPPAHFETCFETSIVDLDEDNIDDIEIRYCYERRQGDQEFSSQIVVLNSNFHFASQLAVDTIYKCVEPTEDGTQTTEFTGSANYVCPNDGVLTVLEVVTQKLAACFSVGDTLNKDINWQSDPVSVINGRHDRWYTDIESVYLSDIHHGGPFNEVGYYLGIRKVVTSGYKYGFIKIHLIPGSYGGAEVYETFLDN